ncbi:hypothetical protein EJ06DRAFT_525504 [Trichodelitschia bisporula]|uniref:HIT-type domain-containing protein n=1 Tax=Trichodelitschia bisporula TaxID=703511 RepID=A0A6G1I9I2_9PEZI|nr:hypothetical protein EJ06DRAFT_525504 [Trichodelitschia bisporula]
MATTCGVCKEASPKYKCPHCQLPYCSIKCFKEHILVHENEDTTPQNTTKAENSSSPPTTKSENTSASSTTIREASSQPTAPSDSPQQNPFLALRNHPAFLPLFMKYPHLRSQLRQIYTATLNPAVPAAELYRDEDGDEDKKPVWEPPPGMPRVEGQWTQEKADDVAVEVLSRLVEKEEGVREFMALVEIVFGEEE